MLIYCDMIIYFRGIVTFEGLNFCGLGSRQFCEFVFL